MDILFSGFLTSNWPLDLLSNHSLNMIGIKKATPDTYRFYRILVGETGEP